MNRILKNIDDSKKYGLLLSPTEFASLTQKSFNQKTQGDIRLLENNLGQIGEAYFELAEPVTLPNISDSDYAETEVGAGLNPRLKQSVGEAYPQTAGDVITLENETTISISEANYYAIHRDFKIKIPYIGTGVNLTTQVVKIRYLILDNKGKKLFYFEKDNLASSNEWQYISTSHEDKLENLPVSTRGFISVTGEGVVMDNLKLQYTFLKLDEKYDNEIKTNIDVLRTHTQGGFNRKIKNNLVATRNEIGTPVTLTATSNVPIFTIPKITTFEDTIATAGGQYLITKNTEESINIDNVVDIVNSEIVVSRSGDYSFNLPGKIKIPFGPNGEILNATVRNSIADENNNIVFTETSAPLKSSDIPYELQISEEFLINVVPQKYRIYLGADIDGCEISESLFYIETLIPNDASKIYMENRTETIQDKIEILESNVDSLAAVTSTTLSEDYLAASESITSTEKTLNIVKKTGEDSLESNDETLLDIDYTDNSVSIGFDNGFLSFEDQFVLTNTSRFNSSTFTIRYVFDNEGIYTPVTDDNGKEQTYTYTLSGGLINPNVENININFTYKTRLSEGTKIRHLISATGSGTPTASLTLGKVTLIKTADFSNFAMKDDVDNLSKKYNVETYTLISDLGLTDTNFSSTDWEANALAIVRALNDGGTRISNLTTTIATTTAVGGNIYPNLVASLQSILGITDTSIRLDVQNSSNEEVKDSVVSTEDGVNIFRIYLNNKNKEYFGTYDNLWRGWKEIITSQDANFESSIKIGDCTLEYDNTSQSLNFIF